MLHFRGAQLRDFGGHLFESGVCGEQIGRDLFIAGRERIGGGGVSLRRGSVGRGSGVLRGDSLGLGEGVRVLF